MSLAQQEFTNAGRNMLGQAQAGNVLNITKIVVGSGSASGPPDLWPLTALIHWEMDVNISRATDLGNGIMLVEGNFASNTAPHAFYLREVGIMANVTSPSGFGTGGPGAGTGPSPAPTAVDQLYSVANVFSDPPDYIDPATPTVQSFKIKLIIDRIPSGDVTVTIAPSDAIIGNNVGATSVGPGPYQSAAGNVLNFKRFVQGAGIILTEDVPETGSKITIATNQLTNSVDLYVPLTYPSPPPGALLFPTIQAAHDYLLGFRIPADKTATIHIAAGTLNTSATTLFTHPDSTQIHIIGQPRVDKTFTTITFISSPLGKQCNITDITGLSVGQLVYLPLGGLYFQGGAKITSVAVNNVRLDVQKKDSQANWTGGPITGSWRLSYFPSVIACSILPNPSDVRPVFSFINGIGSVENLTISGGWAGISIQGPGGSIKNCQIYNAIRGINVLATSLSITGEVAISTAVRGIAGGCNLSAFDSVASNLLISACNSGIQNLGSSALGSIGGGMSSLVYLIHNNVGLDVGNGSSANGGAIGFAYNDVGMQAALNSVISITSASQPSVPGANGTNSDLVAQGSSYIHYDKGASTNPDPSCTPTKETVGNQNSFIHVFSTS